ncbi:hypothetical protein RF55_25324, partial [Lasius niger]
MAYYAYRKAVKAASERTTEAIASRERNSMSPSGFTDAAGQSASRSREWGEGIERRPNVVSNSDMEPVRYTPDPTSFGHGSSRRPNLMAGSSQGRTAPNPMAGSSSSQGRTAPNPMAGSSSSQAKTAPNPLFEKEPISRLPSRPGENPSKPPPYEEVQDSVALRLMETAPSVPSEDPSSQEPEELSRQTPTEEQQLPECCEAPGTLRKR